MARVAWMCRLREHPFPTMWEPKILTVLSALGPLPKKMKWSTTDAVRAAKFAAGWADLDAAQLAAVQADPDIHLIPESKWTERFNQQTVAFQDRLNTFADAFEFPRPSGPQTLRQIWNFVIDRIDNKTLDQIL